MLIKVITDSRSIKKRNLFIQIL